MPLPQRSRRFLFLILLMLAAPGCRSGSTEDGKVSNAMVMARLCAMYARTHKGLPPRNAEALKAHARKMSADELKAAGTDASHLDAAFSSPRDSKPYVFRDPARYKNKAGAETVVLYEAEGSGGKRVVIYPTGKTEEVTADKLKELVPEAN